ncbi:MAG TPA: class I SAM-dependent methyltransferase [Syntrophorhabdales bacterium]|nr:class I SAM-dependent methyltransferase [Syntrophorhabdales bacterium]
MQTISPYDYLPYSWLFERDDLYGYGTEYWGYLDIIAGMVSHLNPQSILDVGCGHGFMSDFIAKRTQAQVFGIDISERAITYAKLLSGSAQFECIELIDIVRRGWKFDCVLAIEVLEHIDPEQLNGLLDNLIRTVRPGSSLIVSVPSTKKPVIRPDHFQHFTEEGILNLLASNSLRPEKIVFQHDVRFQRRARRYRRLLRNRYYRLTFLEQYLVGLYFRKHNRMDTGGRAGRFIIQASCDNIQT